MGDDIKVKCCGSHGGAFMGPLWAIGWIFTIGYLKLTFWKAVLGIIVWPYYLGVFFHK
jgi:hypothetical protein